MGLKLTTAAGATNIGAESKEEVSSPPAFHSCRGLPLVEPNWKPAGRESGKHGWLALSASISKQSMEGGFGADQQ